MMTLLDPLQKNRFESTKLLHSVHALPEKSIENLKEKLSEKSSFDIKNISHILERPGTDGKQFIALNCQSDGKKTTRWQVNEGDSFGETIESAGSIAFYRLSEDESHFYCSNTIQLD